MKISRRFILTVGALLLGSALVLAAVFASRDLAVQEYLRGRAARAVVADYVDNAVLKTLDLLVGDIETLHAASQKLQAAPTPQNYAAVTQAWTATQNTWMTAAAYLYGPAAQHDYHKRIATWPVEKVLLDHTLGQLAAGTLAVDARYLREEVTAGHRGLYAVQYLLFREGKPRDPASFRAEELHYLTATTQAMLEDAIDFEATWIGTENLPPARLAVVRAAGIKDRTAYAEEFKNPESPASRYTSISVPLQEIFQEITGVLEDMAEPLSALREYAPSAVPAYWDSIDPYSDLLLRLQSAEDAYLGGVPGFREAALSDLVAQHDPALDRLIKISLAHTAHRIKAIRALENVAPEKRALAVRVAENELERLSTRIGTAISPVVLDPAVEPYKAYVK